MKRKLTTTLAILFSCYFGTAQNLVPNYSFEDNTCPSGISQLDNCLFWYHTTASTPDLFTECGAPSVTTPSNNFGYQPARTGNSYGGLITNVIDAQFGTLYNEYMSVPLNFPLIAGHCYYAEMYVNLADVSGVGQDKIGMYFSNTTPIVDAPGGQAIVGPTPQVFAQQIIIDQTIWTRVSGSFVANGGEQVLSIGCFYTELEVNTQPLSNGGWPYSYFFVDDVTVIDLSNNQPLNFEICEGDCFTLGDNSFCTTGSYSVDLDPGGCGLPTTVNVISIPPESVVFQPATDITCSDATATINASGSSGLNFSSFGWTGPNGFTSSNAIESVSEPGTYTFTITNPTGCVSQDSIEVFTDLSDPTVFVDPISPWDCGSTSITLSASSFPLGNTHQWIGPGTDEATSSVSVNQSGAYTFIATGENGCTTAMDIEVPDDYFQFPESSIDMDNNIINCYETEVLLVGISNFGDVSYQWEGPGMLEFSPIVLANQPGVYDFTITTTAGCTHTSSIEILLDTLTPDVQSSISSADCNTGAITLFGNSNTSNVSFNWSGPNLNENQSDVNVTIAGTYTLTVTSLDNGCTASSAVELNPEDFNNSPTLSFQEPDTLDCLNSTAILFGSTNISDATFIWTGPGVNDPAQTSSTNTPGVFTLTVTSPNGCSAQDSIEVIGNYAEPSISIASSGILSCSSGTVTLTGSTNNTFTSYQWFDANDDLIGEIEILTITQPGNYTLLVTDSQSGCTAQDNITVTQDNNVPVANAGANGTLNCINTSFLLNGNSSAGANLGFEWFDNNGISIGTGASVAVTQSGNYTLVVTNTENGCSAQDNTIVDQDVDMPTAITGTDGILNCFNSSFQLDGSNSTGNNLSYEWFDVNDNSIGATELLTVTQPGDYSLIITNTQNGCSALDNTTVGQDIEDPSANAGSDGFLDCSNTSFQLDGSNSSGDNLSYEWFDDNNDLVSSSAILTVTQPGDYTLVVTNTQNGCSAQDDTTVGQDNNVPTANAGADGTLDCVNSTFQLDGSNSSGNNLSYEWFDENNDLVSSSDILTVTLPGDYTLIITNTQSGCSSQDNSTVVQNIDMPTANAGADGFLDCDNASFQLYGSNSFGDNLSYEWYDDNNDLVGSSDILTVTIPGNYMLVVTNTQSGCSTQDEAIVGQDNSVPTANAGADGFLDCTNSSFQLDGSNSSGDNLSYEWFDGNGDLMGTTETILVTLPGDFTLVVTNSINGCFAQDEVFVGQDSNVPTANAGADGILDCLNTDFQLDGSASAGNNLSYEWFDSNDNLIAITETVNITQPGDYTLIITDTQNGCSSQAEAIVNQDNNVPTANAGIDGFLDCTNSSFQLDGSNSSGDNLSYEWFDGNGDLMGTTETILVTLPGDFTLVVTNTENGCFAQDVATVSQDNSIPTANAGADGFLDCSTSSFQLDGSNSSGDNLSYEWFDSNSNLIGATELLEATQLGDYTLVVTNTENGCSAQDVATVSQDNDVPVANAGADGDLDCINSNFQLDGSNSSGDNLSYEWINDNGDLLGSADMLTVTQPGNFTLVVTNTQNGCSAQDNAIVSQDIDVPTADAGADGFLDCDNASFQLDGSNSSGDNLSYGWFDDNDNLISSAEMLTVTQPGDFTLIVTNTQNGCATQDNAIVSQDTGVPTADAGADGFLDCSNSSFQLDGSNSSGDNLNYEWFNDNGDLVGSADLLTVTQPGSFTLVVSNTQNGCSAQDNAMVNQDTDVPTAIAGADGILNCLNTSFQLDGSASIGDNLNYEWFDNNSNSVGNSEMLSVAQAGDYVLVITNTSNGCSAQDEATVSQNIAMSTADAGVDGFLDCVNSNFEMDGSSSTGDNLSYEWFNANGELMGATEIITVAQSGDFTLIVTNTQNGCSAQDEVSISQDTNLPTAIAGADGVLDCMNSSYQLDGSNSIGDNLVYEWFDANNDLVSNNEMLMVTQPGDYTLVVTNSLNSCSTPDVVVVNQDIVLPTANAGTDGILNCAITNFQLDGSASTGQNISYEWLDANDDIIGSSEMLTVTQPGEYNLVVTNLQNGCSAQDAVLVNQNISMPTANAGQDDILDCINTNIQLNGSTSLGDNLSYEWFNNNGDVIGTTEILNVTQPDDYTLVVTNTENSCFDQDIVTVNQDVTLPIANAGQDGVLDCINTNYQLDGSASSGNNLSYEWFDNNGDLIGDSEILNTDFPGDYLLIVTNSQNGCSTQDGVLVSQNIAMPSANAGPDALLNCMLTNFELNGSTSTGDNLSYEWFDASGILIDSIETLTITQPGDYTLVVTNTENGCFDEDEVVVNQDIDTPIADVGSDGLLDCINTSYQLDGSVSSGANLNFEWLDTAGNLIGSSELLTVTDPGDYTLVVTNTQNGCSALDGAFVNQDIAMPIANAGADGLLDCINTSYVLNGSNSTGENLNYEWFNATGNLVGGTDLLNVIQPDDYTLLVTNTQNGCTAQDNSVVEQDITPPTANTGANGILDCNNPTFNLDASNSSGGQAFNWFDNMGTLISTSPTLEIDMEGLYTLIVTNTMNGCTADDNVEVSANFLTPLASISADGNITCIDQEVLLQTANSPTGVSYEWHDPTGQIIGSSENVTVSEPAIYSLFVTNIESGCTDSTFYEVLEDIVAPIANASTLNHLDCQVLTAPLSGAGSSVGNIYTYQWSGSTPPQDATNISANAITEGTYTFLVTNTNNGCTATATTMVNFSNSFVANPEIEVAGPYCYLNLATVVIYSPENGTPPYSYSIDGGVSFSNSNLFADMMPGTYDLLIQDAVGCEAEDTFEVEPVDELDLNLVSEIHIDYGEDRQLLPQINIPESEIASIQWLPASGLDCYDCLTPVVTATNTIRYFVTIVNTSGCEIRGEVLVNVNKAQSVYVPTAFSPNDDGVNDLFRIYSQKDNIQNVNYFRIFDRWGEIVYEIIDVGSPEDYGWDGTLRGRVLNPDVFVYIAEVVLKDGSISTLSGDVTLMK